MSVIFARNSHNQITIASDGIFSALNRNVSLFNDVSEIAAIASLGVAIRNCNRKNRAITVHSVLGGQHFHCSNQEWKN